MTKDIGWIAFRPAAEEVTQGFTKKKKAAKDDKA
jgi:hypothetical protein